MKQNLELNDKTINSALENFTEETDIPCVIVVEDMEEVFDKKVPAADLFTVVFAAGLSGVAIYLIYRAFKSKENEQNR